MQPLDVQVKLKNLLGSLVGKQVTVSKAPAYEPGTSRPASIAVYSTEAGIPAGILVCELKLANYLGAALSMMPAGVAEAAAKARSLDGNLLENFQEVCNICAQLFAEGRENRVVLERIEATASQVPATLKPPATTIALRTDFTLEIAGYGTGAVSARLFS
jgi:hypothetical protein